MSVDDLKVVESAYQSDLKNLSQDGADRFKAISLLELLDQKYGKVIKLTSDVSVTLGGFIDLKMHPSGVRFDGRAVITEAGFNSQGVAWCKAVSVNDPDFRQVTEILN